MSIKVAVAGASGRMGQAVCEAVAGADGMGVVAAVDPDVDRMSEQDVADGRGVALVASVDDLDPDSVDVLVDFTVAEAGRRNLAWCAAHGIHAVVGTTGFTSGDLERFGREFGRSWCLIAPNFAIGAVLMMRFAEMAAPYFDTAEIIEIHHDAKKDAPSGTAMATLERMEAASSDWAADPTADEVVPGARGGGSAGPIGGVRVHAVRMRGAVANQEVILGTTGQTLTVRHDTTDRSSFMPGVVLAVRAAGGRTGLTIGLDALLFDT